MINISGLSIHFANRYLFDNVNFTINPQDRIGLIGRNGTGKSTLLKIICGLEFPEEGNVTMPNDFTLGYLPQEKNLSPDKSVFEETRNALGEVVQLEKKINELNISLSERTDYESVEYLNIIHKLTDANERFKIIGGNNIEAEIEKVLIGLGFQREDFSKALAHFSGGWQMRVELAKILLRKPNCILLDEPTNHLDIESVQWLEETLKNYYGAVVLVSHDRNFLDKVTNRTIELLLGKIYDLPLPYSQFVETRSGQRETLMSQFKQQQKQIKETERFIERFRSKATLASRVQSRMKQLDKMDKIEVEEDDYSSIRFRFPEAPRSGLVVAEAKQLSKRYGNNLVLNKIDFALERGEKVAFVGKNGEGKTTLTKIIAHDEDFEGSFTLGHNVQVGYFAQHQAELLDPNSTVFEIIDSAASGEMRTRVRSLLGAFLFSGEAVYKKVKVLSGGEKSRLAIAKLLLQPINLLILDEPTNHLDMLAKDVLKNALLDYQGALILVSHDRDFLNGLTTKTVHFKDKKIKEYPGSIYEFLTQQKIDNLNEIEFSNKQTSRSTPEELQPSSLKIQRDEQKRLSREENKLRKQIQKNENEIEKLEQEIQNLENEFSRPDFFSNLEESKQKQTVYDDLREQLELKMEEWTQFHQELEEYEKSR